MRESDLCAAFISGIPSDWAVYPEANGYDIFLVRTDGVQLGIHAKLRFTMGLLNQAIPWRSAERLPDYIGVLVPRSTMEGPNYKNACEVGNKIGLFEFDELAGSRLNHALKNPLRHVRCWVADDVERMRVPEFAANVPAGVPCPKTLSEWKIGAIKLSWYMQDGSEFPAVAFRNHGQSTDLWINKGWARRIRRAVYVKGDKTPPYVCFAEEGRAVIESLEGAA